MKVWQRFEDECCEYLNKTYGNNRIHFEVSGGSDSTSSDIKVYINGVNKFDIEVKSPEAQSGQFVVLNENGQLVFSTRNKSDIEEAIPFIDYMNANYSRFATATKSGVDLDIDAEESNKWIIRHYLNKNSRFMITRDDFSFVIFPIEQYGKYFKTTCRYRIKKSGSNEVPFGASKDIISLFSGISSTYKGKKLWIKSSENFSKGDRLSFGDYDYLVSEKADGLLYIRRLSNTNNANVIFVISLKQGQDQRDLKAFENTL